MRVVFAVLFVVASSWATQVQQCQSFGRSIEDLNDRIKIGNCNKPPCRLRKDTIVDITMRFKADRAVRSLKTTVSANILGIPFPFAGVDGEDACKDVYKLDGTTKAGCDFKVGEEYLYKNQIDVLRIYPRVKTVVHWGLTDSDGKDVICFEVPARITN